MTYETIQIPIEVEEQQTWPREFLGDAIANRSLVVSYQLERQRIDRLGWEDVSVRINPPANQYEPEYTQLVDRLEPILVPHRIVGYHCTRLTRTEIADISARGMRVLSAALVQERLDRSVKRSDLTVADYEYLKISEVVGSNLKNMNGNRTGMSWFCPNRSTLRISSGVYRLFRSWGGEAIYCGLEGDVRIADVLRRIGTPCIVKCAIPLPWAVQYHVNFTERFLSRMVSRDVKYPEPCSEFDMHTKQDLAPGDILDIVEFSDPRFEILTGCAGWATRERIA
jgi:hypothetical protein